MEGDMATLDIKNDGYSDILNTSYQPNISITRSSNTGKFTQSQTLRQMWRRNSVGDLLISFTK